MQVTSSTIARTLGLLLVSWAVCLVQAPSTAVAQNGSLLSVFSDSDAASTNNFSFTTNSTDLSGSNWGFGVNENDVFHQALIHEQTDGAANSGWEVRVGQGGQIYSIRNDALGEIVPPQTRDAPYVDEVFQSISVDRSLRNANTGDQAAFYHQSGYYVDNNNVRQPTYSPLLASGVADSNSYSTLSLAVQADTESNPQQPGGLLNYQRTRDLGDGVIEVTHGIYNFGNHTVDFHNLPWGGVRKTILDNMLVSNPDGGFTNRAIEDFGDFENQVVFAEDTGGWAAFTEGTEGTDQGIAYVFGNDDTHLGEDWQRDRSSWRWGDGGGDFLGIPIRNFNVGTFRRVVDVDPGDLFESRYFLVLGDVDHIESTIEDRGLVDAATYDQIIISESDSDELSWRVVDDNGSISVLESAEGDPSDFKTYAKPVNGSVPLLLFEDASGRQFLSVDPYALSDTPYDGETTYEGLLGFVLPEDIIASEREYVDLDTIFGDGFYLNTNPGVTIFALQGTAAVPEPSGLVLILVGCSCLLRRRRNP